MSEKQKEAIEITEDKVKNIWEFPTQDEKSENQAGVATGLQMDGSQAYFSDRSCCYAWKKAV